MKNENEMWLAVVKSEMELVFDQIMKAMADGNDALHKSLIDKFNELESREIRLMKELGKYVEDPCVLKSKNHDCFCCSGTIKSKKVKGRTLFYMGGKDDEVCGLKEKMIFMYRENR